LTRDDARPYGQPALRSSSREMGCLQTYRQLPKYANSLTAFPSRRKGRLQSFIQWELLLDFAKRTHQPDDQTSLEHHIAQHNCWNLSASSRLSVTGLSIFRINAEPACIHKIKKIEPSRRIYWSWAWAKRCDDSRVCGHACAGWVSTWLSVRDRPVGNRRLLKIALPLGDLSLIPRRSKRDLHETPQPWCAACGGHALNFYPARSCHYVSRSERTPTRADVFHGAVLACRDLPFCGQRRFLSRRFRRFHTNFLRIVFSKLCTARRNVFMRHSSSCHRWRSTSLTRILQTYYWICKWLQISVFSVIPVVLSLDASYSTESPHPFPFWRIAAGRRVWTCRRRGVYPRPDGVPSAAETFNHCFEWHRQRRAAFGRSSGRLRRQQTRK